MHKSTQGGGEGTARPRIEQDCSERGRGDRKEWGHEEGRRAERERTSSEPVPSFLLFTQRIHLDIRVGEHDLDAAIAQAKDKVNEVSFKLEHLIEQIEQIVKEQNYQRVGLPIQLIPPLPARNVILQTKPPKQGKNKLPVSRAFSELELQRHAGGGGGWSFPVHGTVSPSRGVSSQNEYIRAATHSPARLRRLGAPPSYIAMLFL